MALVDLNYEIGKTGFGFRHTAFWRVGRKRIDFQPFSVDYIVASICTFVD